MLAIASPLSRQVQASPALLALLALSIGVAAVGPFDHVVDLLTRGSALARMVLMAAVVLAGSYCALQAELTLKGESRYWPVIALGSALAIAIYVCVIDGILFRRILPAEYVLVFHTQSLGTRLSYYFMRAFQENVIYRLFVFSTLAYLIARLKCQPVRELSPWLVCLLSFGVQGLNVWINTVSGQPLSAELLTYDVLRYVVPGAAWGWLYWRNGFTTIEVGHVGSHVFLQPALGILI